jgi:hypothetical protein
MFLIYIWKEVLSLLGKVEKRIPMAKHDMTCQYECFFRYF